jgi:membrane-associated phospholipid phosphatase
VNPLALSQNGDSDSPAVQSGLRWALFAVATVVCFLADGPIYKWVHENYNYRTRPVPDSMKITTRVMRSFEDWGENVYILAVAYGMWQLDSRRRSRVLLLALAAVLVALGVEGVKRIAGRERPEVSLGHTVFHGPGKWLGRDAYTPLASGQVPTAGDYQSFPSGHTAAAGAYSGALAAFYPQLRPIWIALAAGCGANRIWKERHFLSDCWIGGAFGFWLAYTLPRRRWVQGLAAWFDARFAHPQCADAQFSGLRPTR